MKSFAWLSIPLLLLVYSTGCKKSIDTNAPIADTTSAAIAAPFTESFESADKQGYEKAYIKLSSGVWLFDDAALGGGLSDKMVGQKAVRLRNNGSIAMKFDVSNGAKTVIITHGTYNHNPNSTWQLWVSENSGASFVQVGNTITSTQILRNDTFTVNAAASFRLIIRKVSGGANQLNIDDVHVTNQVLPVASNDGHPMLLGNPSNATADVMNVNNYLMDKVHYMLSYSRDRGTPNWVSWHLASHHLGTVSRQDDFRTDFSFPFSWYHVSDASYSGSGFDRGHNVPSGDRTATVDANSSTFLMTNIIPQAPLHNQQMWAGFEDYCRSLARQGNELYITMGSYGQGGTGAQGYKTTIDNGNVTVPAMIWKVVVVLPNGNNDLQRVNPSTRVITINSPNNNTVVNNWRTYRTSVDDLEQATGYDLLSNLPQALQQVLEAVVDNQ